MSASGRPDQFVALAGLRGVAALVVLQWHAQRVIFGPVLPGGYLAVDFFFLLSGWVLAHAYDRRLADGLTVRQFMRLRLIRLYPVYLLAVLMMLAGWALGGRLSLPGPLLALLFLPDLLAPGLDWVVAPAWSLAAELAANIPFAACHKGLTTRVLAATALLSAAALAWWALTAGGLDLGYLPSTRLGMFARVFYSFPLGVLLYRHRARLAGWAPRWSAWPACGLLLLILAIPAPPPLRGLADLATVLVLLPLALLFAANAAAGPATIRLMGALGAVSYPLYLIHMPLLLGADALDQVLTGQSIIDLPPAGGLALILAIIGLAWLVDRFYDQPIRRWLSTVGSAAAKPAPLAAEPTA
ncbi:MAG TPA: acyltransferase [Devosia sp.]|nr:acyltransferase [Devosia sp.]